MCTQAMDIITIGGTGRIMIIGDMAGVSGVIMIGTRHIITAVITTVGLITILTVITIMAILITTVATMAITAIMFTAAEAFHIVQPDEIVCHQIIGQTQPEAAMQILRDTIHLEGAVTPIQTL